MEIIILSPDIEMFTRSYNQIFYTSYVYMLRN